MGKEKDQLVTATPLRVLVVDDEKNIRSTLAMCLEGLGCSVIAAGSGSEAAAVMRQMPFDLAFLDLRLRNETGLDLIPQLLAESPGLSIVMLTAYASLDTAVEAIKAGAADYLAKPFTPDQIRHAVSKVAERQHTLQRLAEMDQELRAAVPEAELQTRSARMQTVLDTVHRAAAADAAVLLRGENGTGKGVLARLLHAESPRRERPFVVVNCPTLSGELLASELFGHVRGAFTGAVQDQPGKVEAAQGGTLFLDEIAEISPGLQAKLLRFLEEKAFERLGESRTRRADMRIVAATNRDLEVDVAAGRFRQDLLYRLNVIEIEVPPLRERREDIPVLAQRFLAFFARTMRRPVPVLSAATHDMLVDYPWPGNVRELRNTIERSVILWPHPTIEPEAFPERMQQDAAKVPQLGGDCTLEEIERQHILRVLTRTATQEDAAQTLGIDVSTLWRKRKKYEAE
ncbi:MAG: sigma-54-dependent Fis family transcriptional regulator [Rhodopirellula sp.]|nr:sigma-54-dependent Fis family transcriptional regulator [Rhodopirellula sp.]